MANSGEQVSGSSDVEGLFVLTRRAASRSEFIQRWAACYSYAREDLYERNISGPLNAGSILELFEWKNGSRLSRRKEDSVRHNFIGRLDTFHALPDDTSAAEFLAIFDKGGVIWRIYWLHVWRPERFPIYDQHVHRAMTWIEEGRGIEIPDKDAAKLSAYLERYIPFHALFDGEHQRVVDRALWACGKFMKRLPANALDIHLAE